MIDKFIEILGDNSVLTKPSDLASFLSESRALITGNARAVLLPSSTLQVSQIMRYCYDNDISMVVQGGNTGRMLGALSQDADAVIISTNRLNRIREVNVINRSMTVEAGVVLADIQKKAGEYELFFPLSIGAEGSCQIGGNLATNCGGMNTLRYGNTRDLVIGIEAVLPNGEILNLLSSLRKNNMGYDLRNLLIGSEGTLGIITAATLKLFTQEKYDTHAFVGMNSIDDATKLLSVLQSQFPNKVSTFELIGQRCLSYVEKYSDIQLPMKNHHAWYVWYRIADADKDLEEAHMTFLMQSDLMEQYEFILAQNSRHKSLFRDIRETVVNVQRFAKSEVKFDVSVPIDKIAFLVERGMEIGKKYSAIAYPFGHVGDGNIHFNFSPPDDRLESFTKEVYELVIELGGSISAEHGIGQRKVTVFKRYLDPVAWNMMLLIKRSFDPKRLLNPHTLFIDENME